MASLQQKVGALGAPAKLALAALGITGVGGVLYALNTYEARRTTVALPAVLLCKPVYSARAESSRRESWLHAVRKPFCAVSAWRIALS